MKRVRRDDGLEEFWPAYTDILMVVCLILVLLVITFVLARPDTRIHEEQERRKDEFATAFHRAMASEEDEGLVSFFNPPGATQVITFSDQLLFDSGDAELRRPRGRVSLGKLGDLMRGFQVARKDGPLYETAVISGHTDEDPIQTERYPSNWHLSSARATSVVYFFVRKGLPANTLSATGYADTRSYVPITGERITTKARKRRIELEISYPEPWLARQMGISKS